MKKTYAAILCSFAFAFAAQAATVNLQFSSPFGGGIATNFANAAGTPTNGMIYGVIVDTSGNGFLSGNYQPFTLTNGYLSSGSGVTDDYFALSSNNNTTTDTSAFTESPSSSSGGVGTINLVSGVPYGNLGTSTLDAGDQFLLVWFATSSATAGSKYGVLGNSAFIIPADGSTTSFDSVFVGPDPVRSATYTITPEPTSITLALAAGAVGLLRRRRRL